MVSESINTTLPVALMCSGQGSQKPGMGNDVVGLPAVARAVECASDITGVDVQALLQPTAEAAEALSDTRNSQLAISVLSIGLAQTLLQQGLTPRVVLGFSLGQISALAVSEMLSLEDTFKLLDVRSRAMADAAAQRPGAMTALLKGSAEEVETACERCAHDDVLVPANYNCPGQIVVSGDVCAIERVEKAWVGLGKRFSRLATAGAFHSPLMQPAADALSEHLSTVAFNRPKIDLLCNVDAAPLKAEAAREHLTKQITHPVLFEQSVVRAANDYGATLFVEAGFGGVLANLVRRIDKDAKRSCVQDTASLEETLALLSSV